MIFRNNSAVDVKIVGKSCCIVMLLLYYQATYLVFIHAIIYSCIVAARIGAAAAPFLKCLVIRQTMILILLRAALVRD